MTWNYINYEVTLKRATKEGKSWSEKKRIVNNACGYAIPGETLFIMGASGAGKTSLLNILSDRIRHGGDSVLSG